MKKLLPLGLVALALTGCVTSGPAITSPAEVAALPLCPDALGRTEPPGLWAEAQRKQGNRAACRCPSGKVAAVMTYKELCWQPAEYVAAAFAQKSGAMTVAWGGPVLADPARPSLDAAKPTDVPAAPPPPSTLPTLD
jgi:hypothetical protein